MPGRLLYIEVIVSRAYKRREGMHATPLSVHVASRVQMWADEYVNLHEC